MMTDLQRLIARDALRRDLMNGAPYDPLTGRYDNSTGNKLMRRAAEEIDAMQDEINRLRAVDAKGGVA